MTNDRKDTLNAATVSVFFVSIIWAVFLINEIFSLKLQQYGLSPREWTGLFGILTMPLLHANWGHIISNTTALLLLNFGLFFFYKKDARKILLCLYLVSGLLTWIMGRPSSTHIGASGLVYALAAFEFVSGIIKKVPRQMAFAMLIAFLYGGFIWAFFPEIYKNTNISWEGHLSGLLTGIVFAFYFRNVGPEPPVYSIMLEKDDENEDEEDAYWKIPIEENPEQQPNKEEKTGND